MKPLGFQLDDRQMRQAGLDYHEFATIKVHESWTACAERFTDRRLFAVSTKGMQRYDLVEYGKDHVVVFGPETRGLPAALLESFPEERRLRLPMRPNSRSLNLSNATAIVVYKAWRQVGFSQEQ